MARLPPAPVPVDCHWPLTTRGHHHNQPPPPPAPHDTAHGTPPIHWEALGRARLQPRMPTRIAAMSDCDGSPRRDDCHHRQSRSAPPSPQDLWGKPTRSARSGNSRRPQYRSGRRPCSPGRPPATLNRPPRTRRRLERTPPPPRPLLPPRRPQEGPGMRKGPWPPLQSATPRPAAHRRHGRRAPHGRLALCWAPPQPQREAGEAPSTGPTRSPATPTPAPPSRTPPKSAFPEGRPRPVPPPDAQAHAARHQAAAAAAARGRGGGGGHGGAGRGADGSRGRVTSGEGGQAAE